MIEGSTIAAVTVHRAGATVERRVRVEVGAGGGAAGDGWPAEVAIVGLPLALADATVRVTVAAVEGGEGGESGSGEAGKSGHASTVLAGDPHVGLYARPPAEVVEAPAEVAVRAARRAVIATERAIMQREAELAMLASAGIEPRPDAVEGQAPPPSPMAARLALVEFTDGLGAARHAEIEALRARLGEERERLAAVLDQARRASSAKTVEAGAVSKQIRVALQVEGRPRAVVLVVSYFVPGARWVPSWQVRLDREGRAASIEMRAQVAQRSGEDWSGVALTVSTADPMRFAELPRLRSIRIGKAQAGRVVAPGFRPPPRGGEVLFADFDRDRVALRAAVPVGVRGEVPGTVEVPGVVVWSPPMAGPGAGRGKGGAWAEAEEDSMADDEVAYDRVAAAAPASFGAGESMRSKVPPSPGAPPPSPSRSAPVARSAAKRSQGSGRMREERGVIGGGGADGGGPPMVQFGALRLADPGGVDGAGSERGRLVAVDRAAQYRDDLLGGGRRLSFDPSGRVAEAEALAAAVGRLALPVNTRPVEDTSGLHDHAWTASAPVDVPGDGGWHAVPIGVRSVPCALRYVVVPRVSPHVFRLAAMVNADGGPLLGGPVEVYVDGSYVLSTEMATVPAGARFDLGLGVEQGIRCARNTRFEEVRSDARVVAMTELRHTIEIELSNRLARTADVEVRERIPQAAPGAEVVVEELAVEPGWSVYEQVERGRPIEGGRMWRVVVGAGESQKLGATYVVKIYAANELVGGNRREA